VVGLGAMLDVALAACKELPGSFDVFNPFVLNPLNPVRIAESVKKTGRLCVVQESAATAGLGDRIVSLITRECFSSLKKAPVLVSSPDMPVPFASELEVMHRPDKDRVKLVISQLIGE
jgi:pyruvate/2-oxoglutarate/acetoin dehydrogenase E1 component